MIPTAISVENLSKRYRIGRLTAKPDTLGQSLIALAKSPLSNFRNLRRLTRFDEGADQSDVLWALRDVSFEVKQGEVCGVIGANGAGKSTLLKVISRITPPTTGRIGFRGRVSSLLEVGTGFHPELTGRENVFLNGTILGMRRKEITHKFDEIVDFSDLHQFIDTPVKRYSSGMRVRLAFSVAAHLEPEILLIDEVLAVGDLQFQKRCLGKMGEVARAGRTILFISHNIGAVLDLCQTGLLLKNGKVEARGPVVDVVEQYTLQTESSSEPEPGTRNPLEVDNLRLIDGDSRELSGRRPFTCAARIRVTRPVRSAIVHFHLLDARGMRVCHITTDTEELGIEDLSIGTYQVSIQLPVLWLSIGSYSMRWKIDVTEETGFAQRIWSPQNPLTIIDAPGGNRGQLSPTAEWSLERK